MTAYTVKHTNTGLLVIHGIDMRQRHAVLLVNSYRDRGEKKKPQSATRRNGREELRACLVLWKEATRSTGVLTQTQVFLCFVRRG